MSSRCRGHNRSWANDHQALHRHAVLRPHPLAPSPPTGALPRQRSLGREGEETFSKGRGAAKLPPFPLEYPPLPLRRVWLRGGAFMQGEGWGGGPDDSMAMTDPQPRIITLLT